MEYEAYQWGIQPCELGEYTLLQIARYIVAKSDKRIIDEQIENEKRKKYIYEMSSVMNAFFARTLNNAFSKKKQKFPTYEEIFSTQDNKHYKYDDLGLVVERDKAFDFIIKNKVKNKKGGE